MRNSGPEKTITEPEVLAWANRAGMDLSVVDTSAVWNPMAGRYLRRQASESLPDLIGNYGPTSVWIELKAPGKRSVINAKGSRHQREFLIRKIKQGCFACVTDGEQHLRALFTRWVNAPDIQEKVFILLNDLPQSREFFLQNKS
jgi:hypothetical protein